MLSAISLNLCGFLALVAQAAPSEADLLAALPDYSQAGYGYGQEPPQVAVALGPRFASVPDPATVHVA